MERAARLIKKSKFSQKVFTDEDFARAVWPTAVGKAIAKHTLRVKLVRSTLVVEVEDAIWQKQLYCLSMQIVDRLRKVTGSTSIEDVEFRVGAPRRAPQRAMSRESVPLADLAPDEADGIQDPVLKKLYRLSRKKATA
jgi:predicted nucleic acid-binding Zn ribbon protein